MEQFGNYKIKVNNDFESKEIRSLLESVGISNNEYTFEEYPCWIASWNGGYSDYKFGDLNVGMWREEITLPKLRDMVSAHRKPTEQGLISGADALSAIADGKDVEYSHEEEPYGRWATISNFEEYSLDYFLSKNTKFKYRIKPSTITLNLSLVIPAPFEPKIGDVVWFIDCETNRGYSSDEMGGEGFEERWIQFGTWRTEDQIKQVVAALRNAINKT